MCTAFVTLQCAENSLAFIHPILVSCLCYISEMPQDSRDWPLADDLLVW